MVANPQIMPEEDVLFQPGQNCSYAVKADHMAVIVDCGNYYRNLRESIIKAKHSIFITGWDIDSRIELTRGTDSLYPSAPNNLYDLLIWKAKANPDLRIYLNKWNYAFFMAATREPWAVWKWLTTLLPNIFYCRDDHVPVGACHHQKIVVIDDETAYCGGMDVAIGRWDMRDHTAENPHRSDPGGLFRLIGRKKYTPFHDIQSVVSGEAARSLAEISRERWRLAAGYDPVPIRPASHGNDIPQSWPDTDKPDFEDIHCGIARTIPAFANLSEAYEIEQIYLDQIARAEYFIYMENQYFTRKSIAKALNKRLHEKPDLRVLLVSSHNPQGVVEKKTMWVGRLKFKDILMKGSMEDRACMAYPASISEKGFVPVRIHSKFMVVDDTFLHIGSANINNRSMKMDTECDMVFRGTTDAHRKKISAVRNDLIREHNGFEAELIEARIQAHVNPREFLERLSYSTQHFVEIDDMEFFDAHPEDNVIDIMAGDPEAELIPELPIPLPTGRAAKYFQRGKVKTILFFMAAVLLLGIAWRSGLLSAYASQEELIATFSDLRNMQWVTPAAIAVYTLAICLFMPITVLTGVMAIVFGPWHGLAISAGGAACSLAIGFLAGRLTGRSVLKLFAGTTVERIKSHAESSGVASITMIRMLPLAPFMIVNIAFGMLRAPFAAYMAGSLLGLLPGTVAAIFIGQSIGEFWTNPGTMHTGLIVVSVIVWAGAVWFSHAAYSRWQARTKRKNA